MVKIMKSRIKEAVSNGYNNLEGMVWFKDGEFRFSTFCRALQELILEGSIIKNNGKYEINNGV